MRGCSVICYLYLGVPPLQNAPPPPPPALTTPTLTGADGSQVYLTIVETIFGCPVSCAHEFATEMIVTYLTLAERSNRVCFDLHPGYLQFIAKLMYLVVI